MKTRNPTTSTIQITKELATFYNAHTATTTNIALKDSTVKHTTHVSSKDVLPSKHVLGSKHESTKERIKWVNLKSSQCDQSTRSERMKIVEDVIKTVHKNGGRFLNQIKGEDKWEVMSNKECKSKVQSAFSHKQRNTDQNDKVAETIDPEKHCLQLNVNKKSHYVTKVPIEQKDFFNRLIKRLSKENNSLATIKSIVKK